MNLFGVGVEGDMWGGESEVGVGLSGRHVVWWDGVGMAEVGLGWGGVGGDEWVGLG